MQPAVEFRLMGGNWGFDHSLRSHRRNGSVLDVCRSWPWTMPARSVMRLPLDQEPDPVQSPALVNNTHMRCPPALPAPA